MSNLSPKIINVITNIVAIIAFVVAILQAIQDYINSQPFEILSFFIMLGLAIVAWFTGKSGLFIQKNDTSHNTSL